jgi:hypothetical protein
MEYFRCLSIQIIKSAIGIKTKEKTRMPKISECVQHLVVRIVVLARNIGNGFEKDLI